MAGCVFKRGAVWYMRYDLPPDKDGKRHEKKQSCKGLTKKEAEQWLAEIQTQMLRGMYAN